MESLYFLLAAVALYFLSDRVLDAAERFAGRRFAYRTIIFFCLLLGFTFVTFAILRRILGGD